MKKIVVIAIIVALCLTPLTAFETDAATDKTSTYWDEGVYSYRTFGVGNEASPYRSTITGYADGNISDIKIKAALEGYPLTIIGSNSFSGGITSVIVPATVKTIEDNAFSACGVLKDAYFLGDIPTLGTDAFPAGVEFHYLVETDGWNSYAGAKKEMISTIEGGLKYYVANSVATVHEYISGTNITIPSEIIAGGIDYPVERLGAYAFHRVSGDPISIIFSDNLKVIEERAFYGCSALSTISIDVPYINDEAFRECRNFQGIDGKIIIPDSVKYIGFEAFRMCHSITYVEVKGPFDFFGEGVFRASFALEEIYISGIETTGPWFLDNCTSLKKVTFGDGVVSIGANSFVNDNALETVILPNSLRTIGENAFKGCKNLSSVSLGGVETIGAGAFYDCDSLKSIKIPKSVTKIDYRAFAMCNNLSEALFEGELPEIGDQAFTGCSAKFVIKYKEDNAASWSDYSDYPTMVANDNDPDNMMLYVIIAAIAVVAAVSLLVIMRMRK